MKAKLKSFLKRIRVVLILLTMETSQVYIYFYRDLDVASVAGVIVSLLIVVAVKVFPVLPHKLEDSSTNQTLYLFYRL